MYSLTLTASERRAIDWIGDRYNHGRSFYSLLCESEWAPDDADWDADCDMTFKIVEHVAWMIRDLFEEEDFTFACFAPALVSKLIDFTNQIV